MLGELTCLDRKQQLFWDEDRYWNDSKFIVYQYKGLLERPFNIQDLKNMGIEEEDMIDFQPYDLDFNVYQLLPNKDESYNEYWAMVMNNKKKQEEKEKEKKLEQFNRLKGELGLG